MDCRDAFHAVLCLYCCITDKEYEAYWLMGFPIINLWGAYFTSIFSLFSEMAGWIAGILFMLFFAYILLCNEHNKAEYEAYWLISVPIIHP